MARRREKRIAAPRQPTDEAGTVAVGPAVRWGAPALVALLTFVAFVLTFGSDFVNWDDEANLVHNRHFRGFGPAELRWMWTSTVLGVWEPLAWMVKAAQAVVGGVRPQVFHAVSLFIHIASALILYAITVRLLRAAMPVVAASAPGGLRAAAATTAIVFAVHPLRAEAVAWATCQPYVLAGLFTLLSVLAYLRSCETAGRGSSPRRWYVLSIVCAAAAMLSKAAAIPLIVALVVLDVYPLGRLGRPRDWLSPAARRVWLAKAPFVALALAASVAAAWATRSTPVLGRPAEYGPAERIASAMFGFAFSIGKSVVPVGLSPFYSLPRELSLLEPRFFVSGILVVGLTAALVAVARRWPGGLAAWAWYLAFLFPVAGIVRHGSQLTADRYSYLSCVAPVLLIGGGVLRLWRQGGGVRSLVVAGGAGAVICLCGLTWRQVFVWHNSETLWRHALAVDPRSTFARVNLAIHYQERLALDRAIEQYEAALATDPADAKAHSNLASALTAKGELAQAVEHCRQAIRLMPELSSAQHNYSIALLRLGRFAEAEAAARQAVRQQRENASKYRWPESPDAYDSLGYALFKQGKAEEAARQYRNALQVDPDYREARRNLGSALASAGHLDEAISEWGKLLQSDPNDAELHYYVAAAQLQAGRPAEARNHLEQVLRIDPTHRGARQMLQALQARTD